MLVEIKCPDCGKTHFYNIGIEGIVKMDAKGNGDAVIIYSIDTVKVDFVPDVLISENI